MIYAVPQMEKYVKKSAEIVSIFLDYFGIDDIHIYSIDELFIDLTPYLKLYKKDPDVLCKDIQKEIFNKTGLTLTCGIGPNMFLAKVADDHDAKYAKEVRVYFENCKKIVQIYGERDEYKQIVLQGKDLTIWERMAVMLWAMGCANELFKAFGKNHLSSDIMSKAEAIHKEDIMQIFATRIFKKYINEPSVTPGMLAKSRDKMMKEKLLEMYSKYKISMSETSAYKTFVHELDDVYDRVKGNAVFIRIMKEQFVDEFVKDEREIQDEGRYLSLLVAMGLHMSDYVRFMSGNDIDYCPNMKFVLSGLNVSQLEANTEFRYKDPAYSGEYSNRVYGWLDSVGVKHLKALVGNKLIMP